MERLTLFNSQNLWHILKAHFTSIKNSKRKIRTVVWHEDDLLKNEGSLQNFKQPLVLRFHVFGTFFSKPILKTLERMIFSRIQTVRQILQLKAHLKDPNGRPLRSTNTLFESSTRKTLFEECVEKI